MNAVTEVMDELRKALSELEDCRARNADLRTMLEQVTSERDEARAELAALRKRVVEALPYPTDDDSDESRTAEETIEMAVAERDAAYRSRDLAIKMWDEERALRIRLGVEVKFLRERTGYMREDVEERWKRLIAERDEARAERDAAVRRISEVGVMVATNGNRLAKDAYKRGAEAMREACAAALMADGLVLSRERAANVVRALPIPEEP